MLMAADASSAITVVLLCMAWAYLMQDKLKEFAKIGDGTMTEEIIRLREEFSEQYRALKELKELGNIYGFDISKPATNAKEAFQWSDDTAGAGGGFAFVDVDDTIIGSTATPTAGCRVRLHPRAGPERADRHADHARSGAAGRGATTAQRCLRVTTRRDAWSVTPWKQTRRLLGDDRPVLVRMDSAYYGRDAVHAAITGGAAVSVTVRLDPAVKTAIASIPEDAWTTIKYPNAIFDEATGTWVSNAEVAEVPYTAFTSKKADRVPGRLVVRRIPDVHAQEAGRGAGHPVRPVALPRVLHRNPRACSTPSPPTPPTAGTRSSSKSTPTSSPALAHPALRAISPPTVPGSCWRSSRSTSPAPLPP